MELNCHCFKKTRGLLTLLLPTDDRKNDGWRIHRRSGASMCCFRRGGGLGWRLFPWFQFGRFSIWRLALMDVASCDDGMEEIGMEEMGPDLWGVGAR